MLKPGQYIKIKSKFGWANALSKNIAYKGDTELTDFFCTKNHRGKNLKAKVVSVNGMMDGIWWEVLVLLERCGEMHYLTVAPGDVEIDIIKTLKHEKNSNKRDGNKAKSPIQVGGSVGGLDKEFTRK